MSEELFASGKLDTTADDGGFGGGLRTNSRKRSRDPESGGSSTSIVGDSSSFQEKKKPKSSGGFQKLGLTKDVLAGILRLGYKVPTPIQRAVLPVALSGKDVLAMARTGSGKTAAFLIPLVEKLGRHSSRIGARAILLSPTRELVLQTLRFAKALAKFTDLRFASLVGGDSMEMQFKRLSENPDVIIATPGRLLHHLLEISSFNLNLVEFVVFDEADRLFEMGFSDQLNDILSRLPEQRQAMLVSATLPKVLVQFAKAGLHNAELVRLDADAQVSDNLRLGFFTIRRDEKPAALCWVLRHVIPKDQQAIVFVATRHHSEYICRLLQAVGQSAETVYGQMDQTSRRDNLAKFVNRRTRVLVVTDVAARGLDIPTLENVINYDFPDKAKLFVHRVGRVARQGRIGLALSLIISPDVPYMLDTLLAIARPVSNIFRGRDADKDASGFVVPRRTLIDRNRAADEGREEGEEGDDGSDDGVSGADSVGGGSVNTFATTATALTLATSAIRYDEGVGYTLDEMRPEDVHYGQIPRSALELELEAVRGALSSDVDLRNLARSAANAQELYNKTRSEASRQSAARAHRLVNDRVHPMLLHIASKGEADLQSYINGLQAFRPQQTMLEIEGAGKGMGGRVRSSSSGTGAGPNAMKKVKTGGIAATMALKRKMHDKALVPRVGSVSLPAAAMAAAQGSLALVGYEGQVGDTLHQVLEGVAASTGGHIDEMVARHLARKETAEKKALRASFEESDGNIEEDEDSAVENITKDTASIMSSIKNPSAPIGKRRLSKAERRTLERAGGGETEKVRIFAARNTSLRTTTEEIADSAMTATISNGGPTSSSSSTSVAGGGVISKSERRKLLREGGELIGNDRTAAAAALFRDRANYISYSGGGGQAALDALAAAEAAQGAAGATGVSKMRGHVEYLGGSSSQTADDLKGLQRFEDSALDLMPDDKDGLAKHGRGGSHKVHLWDPVKKRYVHLPADQVDSLTGKRKASSFINESGRAVGKDKDGQEKSKKHEYGQLYRNWVRKTRQEIRGGGEEDDMDGPPPGEDGSGGDSNGARGRSGVVDFAGDEEGLDSGADGKAHFGGGNRQIKRARKFGRNVPEASSSAAGSGSGSGSGGRFKSELKSASDIKKERLRLSRSRGGGRGGRGRSKSRDGSSTRGGSRGPSPPSRGAAPQRSFKIGGKRGGRGGGRGGRR
jgi:superfamily II DNA/RNA helicase